MQPQPPPVPPSPQSLQDAEHIRLLVIFHYIYAGLSAVFGFFPAIYVVMGFAMLGGAMGASPGSSPQEIQFMGTMFAAMGIIGIVACWAVALLSYFCGKFLGERRCPVFIMVVSCIHCLNMPFGTALGVFTIVVTQRPSVKALFAAPDGAIGSFR